MVIRALLAIVASLPMILGVSCVRHSGGVWFISDAPRPEGWPELTPVGTVELRTYPVYREAQITAERLGRTGTTPLFRSLFGHISENNIAMTAPVDLAYGDSDQVQQMAFLYRSTDIGSTGQQDGITVRDQQSQTYASVGVRGSYSIKNYKRGLAQLESWLESSQDHAAIGQPRYLGYNSPLTPWFWRYGEVQIPVTQKSMNASDLVKTD